MKIKAEIETNTTQEKLNELQIEVEDKCPVYQVIHGSGVSIES